jgi:hypothetical protein
MASEFLFKKMGEVLAFEEVGIETLERSEALLKESVLQDRHGYVIAEARSRIETLREVATELGGSEVMEAKAQKTGVKLRKLREIYLTEPDDFADLLEWLGIHEGGAITHWILIEGEAAHSDSELLRRLAVNGVADHERDFRLFTGALRLLGEEE